MENLGKRPMKVYKDSSSECAKYIQGRSIKTIEN
jgi:hypothetical protein